MYAAKRSLQHADIADELRCCRRLTRNGEGMKDNITAMFNLPALAFTQDITKSTLGLTDALKGLATFARALQLYAHNCHNLIDGAMFLADHKWLSELYVEYEGVYDSLVERLAGLRLGFNPRNASNIQTAAAMHAASWTDEADGAWFGMLLAKEQELQSLIKAAIAANPDMTEGTKNLLAGAADAGEVRLYKLQQRTSGDIAKAGTSDGAKKGWATRQRGGGIDTMPLAPIEHGRLGPAPGSPVGRAVARDTAKWSANKQAGANAPTVLQNRVQGKMGTEPATKDAYSETQRANDLSAKVVTKPDKTGDIQKPTTPAEHSAAAEAHKSAMLMHRGAGQLYPEGSAERNWHEGYASNHQRQEQHHRDRADGFAKSLGMLQSFRARLAKTDGAPQPHRIDTSSNITKSWAAKTLEARQLAKAGLTRQAKVAAQDAAADWRKMRLPERKTALKLVSDNAADDIGKTRNRSFEYGHGRACRLVSR